MKIDEIKGKSRKRCPMANLDLKDQIAQCSTQQKYSPSSPLKVALEPPSIFLDFERNAQGSIHLRKKEITQIENHIKQMNINKKNIYRFLLVVGSSGVGKSMTLKHILSKNTNTIYLSANIYPSIKETLSEISRLCKGTDIQTIKAIDREQYQQTSIFQSKKKSVIIFIEEIDELFKKNKNSEEVQEFFKYFGKDQCKGLHSMILIGTSNDVNLAENLWERFAFLKGQVKSVIFGPYQIQQLSFIIKCKIEQLQQKYSKNIKISQQCITFIANRCSENKKGDTRAVIEFLKKYIVKQVIESQGSIQIDIRQISRWMQQFFNPHSFLLTKLAKKCQIVVIGLYNYLKRSQSLSISYENAIKQCQNIYDDLHINLQCGEFQQIIEQLQSYGVIKKISKKNQKNIKNSKIILKISLSEVEGMFQDDLLFGKFLESVSQK